MRCPFAELGMELEGEAPIEGPWVDRINGLDGVRVNIATTWTPDGHGRLELTKFHSPGGHGSQEPANALGNTLRIRSIMFTIDQHPTPQSPACDPAAWNLLERWRSTRTAHRLG